MPKLMTVNTGGDMKELEWSHQKSSHASSTSRPRSIGLKMIRFCWQI